jgi:hypothetical protein
MHAHDEMAQGTMHNDVERIKKNIPVSSSAMIHANKLAIVSAIAFGIGCVAGIIAFALF